MSSIGKIERVPLREVWKHEALDFTRWLQNNLDVVNSVTDLGLVSAAREQAAGKFSVDLVAEDASGSTVVIENQLEKSDHDHLGKIITYLAALSAKAAVWLLPEARPEHITARLDDAGYLTPVKHWPFLQQAVIDAMIRFDKAVRPYAETAPQVVGGAR